MKMFKIFLSGILRENYQLTIEVSQARVCFQNFRKTFQVFQRLAPVGIRLIHILQDLLFVLRVNQIRLQPLHLQNEQDMCTAF